MYKNKENHEDKPIRRKKLSSNSNKKETSIRGSKSKNIGSKIIELMDIASLDNKGLVKLAKEKKIKENPKDPGTELSQT